MNSTGGLNPNDVILVLAAVAGLLFRIGVILRDIHDGHQAARRHNQRIAP